MGLYVFDELQQRLEKTSDYDEYNQLQEEAYANFRKEVGESFVQKATENLSTLKLKKKLTTSQLYNLLSSSYESRRFRALAESLKEGGPLYEYLLSEGFTISEATYKGKDFTFIEFSGDQQDARPTGYRGSVEEIEVCAKVVDYLKDKYDFLNCDDHDSYSLASLSRVLGFGNKEKEWLRKLCDYSDSPLHEELLTYGLCVTQRVKKDGRVTTWIDIKGKKHGNFMTKSYGKLKRGEEGYLENGFANRPRYR